MSEIKKELNQIQYRWEGTRYGLQPILEKGSPENVLEMKADILNQLINLVSEEEYFINAHILLTRKSGIEYETYPSWNGLIVDISANETVNIDKAQKNILKKRWEKWSKNRNKLKILPTINEKE